ncbi:MAG: uracil-DNA glycosylase [Armatimonadetes bacterium]|nr:uracil-DNA glycosylase [Armatimonadota bacterium]
MNWERLQADTVACDRCARLRDHCRRVAEVKRASYRDQEYWARPVPNFGDPASPILMVGLAPGAHGSNRTGRMFTGDGSGDFLYRALHAVGLCNRPWAVGLDDGLKLNGIAITAVARCAPPGNKPNAEELANCRPYFERTADLMPNLKLFFALGKIAFDETVRLARLRGWLDAKATFAHDSAIELTDGRWLLGCYHPSQQNTFTGRLTPEMMVRVLLRAIRLAG